MYGNSVVLYCRLFVGICLIHICIYPQCFCGNGCAPVGANIWGLIIGLLRLPTMWGLDYLAAGNTKIGEGVMPLLIFGAVFYYSYFSVWFFVCKKGAEEVAKWIAFASPWPLA